MKFFADSIHCQTYRVLDKSWAPFPVPLVLLDHFHSIFLFLPGLIMIVTKLSHLTRKNLLYLCSVKTFKNFWDNCLKGVNLSGEEVQVFLTPNTSNALGRKKWHGSQVGIFEIR